MSLIHRATRSWESPEGHVAHMDYEDRETLRLHGWLSLLLAIEINPVLSLKIFL